MLSDDLKEKLRAWAVTADPDHVPGPDPLVTEQLLQSCGACWEAVSWSTDSTPTRRRSSAEDGRDVDGAVRLVDRLRQAVDMLVVERQSGLVEALRNSSPIVPPGAPSW